MTSEQKKQKKIIPSGSIASRGRVKRDAGSGKREAGRMEAKGRRISGTDDQSGLREPQASYSNDFEAIDRLICTTL